MGGMGWESITLLVDLNRKLVLRYSVDASYWPSTLLPFSFLVNWLSTFDLLISSHNASSLQYHTLAYQNPLTNKTNTSIFHSKFHAFNSFPPKFTSFTLVGWLLQSRRLPLHGNLLNSAVHHFTTSSHFNLRITIRSHTLTHSHSQQTNHHHISTQ